jgi:hypothetical protein
VLVRLGDRIVPQPEHHVPRVGHRLDAAGVRGLQLLDQPEDAVQLGLHRCDLGVGDLDPGEAGDAANVVQAERHCDFRRRTTA